MKKLRTVAFFDNRIDLFRIIAAMAVMYGHIITHMQIPKLPVITEIHQNFSGVIVLFFISGYVITAAVDREKANQHNKKACRFFISRFFRLYPTIVIAWILSAIFILSFSKVNGSVKEWLSYLLSQLTVFQFYSPQFLETYGVGAPNGALWTIPIEIMWYFFAWYLLDVFKKRKPGGQIAIITVFAVISCLYPLTKSYIPRAVFLLIDETPLPYLYILLIGSFLYYHKDTVTCYLIDKWYICLAAYITWCVVNANFVHFAYGTYTDVITSVLLSVTVIAISYAIGGGGKEKGKNKVDLSYGIYVYHMVFVNAFIELFGRGNVIVAIVTGIMTLITSFLSWSIIENNAMKIKNKVLVYLEEKYD